LPQTETRGIASLLQDRITLESSVEELCEKYAKAKPFPHLLMQNLFPERMLDALVAEMPSMNGSKWVEENDRRLMKYNLRSAVDLGETGYQMAAFLNSAGFLYLLSEITGIWNLLPDPYLQGAGYHMIPKGGHFAIHADRNTAYETGLTRRLALLIYLNKNWKHEYGGQLELWSTDATRCEVVVEPNFNNTILFEITDQNFHGVPATVDCPDGRARCSFVVYYHTAAVNDGKNIAPHTSVYAPDIYQPKRSLFRRFAKEVTPPAVHRALHLLKANARRKVRKRPG
jgi:hypothetical protein